MPPRNRNTTDAHTSAKRAADQERTLVRLRRIEGQIRGLQSMVREERACADVVAQVASVQQALRAAAREFIRHHVLASVATASQVAPKESDDLLTEVVDLVYQCSRWT